MGFLIFLFFGFSAFASDFNETLTSDYNATLAANQLGMSYTDYNFMMGFSGLVVGTLFAFGLVSLVLNIGKGR